MNKRTIMFCIFTVNLLLFLSYNIIKFSTYPNEQIGLNKECFTVSCPDEIEREEYIDILYTISNGISADIMLIHLNDDYTYDFYRTDSDNKFIELEDIDDPSGSYATHPANGEKKINGFITKDNGFRILPMITLKSSDMDLSVQELMVNSEDAKGIIDELLKYGMIIDAERGVSIENDFSSLYLVIIIFMIFLVISEIIYAFSRSNEMIILKTMGFRNNDIVRKECKSTFFFFFIIFIIVILINVIIFSMIFDLKSSLLFLKKISVKSIIYIVSAIAIFGLSILLVSSQCNIRNSKGMKFNRELFYITAGFKSFFLIVLAILITRSASDSLKLYNMFQNTELIINTYSDYACTELNTRLEDPMDYPDKYASKFLEFYRNMNTDNNLVIADFGSLNNIEETKENNIPQVTINSNYIDLTNNIFGVDGIPLDSSMLKKEKINFLVPDGYDVSKLTKINISEEDLNYIYYSSDSRFFTFSNEINISEGGYCCNVIAEIYDPEFEYNHTSSLTFTAFMSSFLSNSMFFKYDLQNQKSAYEQIYPVLNKTEIDKIMFSANSVEELFNENLKQFKNNFVFEFIQLIIVCGSFIILVIYTTELYYRNYAKDIALKVINGYCFIEIFFNRMIFKAILLPLLIFLRSVSFPVALFCVLSEQIIFVICVRKNIKRSTVSVFKEE
ncbi:MAG TPA: hypothetical protein PLQ22_02955 [Bacilli bacterium]|nr:hypothetical protein [Bacilli bacterium]